MMIMMVIATKTSKWYLWQSKDIFNGRNGFPLCLLYLINIQFGFLPFNLEFKAI